MDYFLFRLAFRIILCKWTGSAYCLIVVQCARVRMLINFLNIIWRDREEACYGKDRQITERRERCPGEEHRSGYSL